MPYLNVDEVETALSVAAGPPNDAFTQLVTLPHLTWENRQCHALKIASGGGAGRCGVYFIGGVHAREWGSPDILVNFVEELQKAFRTNKGLKFKQKQFTAAEVQHVVNSLDIFVFPQVNPDGRHFSMTVDPMWRKNRRPGSNIGVDINRNYDWLWNFPQKFKPGAPVVSSTSAGDDVYIGPSAASEPETKNVVWMFDQFANIGHFMDIHSFAEDVLYTWGDDDNQTTDPNMNFLNAAFDAKRGVTTTSGLTGAGLYAEHISAADQTALVDLGNRMRDAIEAVRGRVYKVAQSAPGLYVTSGTSQDYAYSRHLADPSKGKVLGYTLEWGPYVQNDVAGSFHPPYGEMKKIIEEVTAGLVEFCLAVADGCSPRVRFDPRKYAALVYILFGVIQDGGGVVITPGGQPIPIDPWGPLRGEGLAPETRQALIGAAVRELAALLDDPAAARALERVGADLVQRAGKQMGAPRQHG